MLELVTTGQFRKDYKRMKKRGCDMEMLEKVIDTLMAQQPLPERCRDHGLTGNYAGFRECHILPDWLLVYAVDKGKLILTASRTGTHADLFTK
ncbi:MAG: type II toxin-antitoxin system YafQ family toxin [Bacillus sp. (in: Bacteria)]|nr:type II toxin-antitoxin system YafQ family toxin [Bacillus sp. (in: firmicutes)]MCM1426587.1 type II toxin-antitoxin system YafQ family toxin [Eubacterium sp.]